MALPHHKNDFKKLPDEKAFFAAFDTLKLPPGNYGFPECKTKESRNDPEVKRRWEAGELGIISVWGKVNMGKNMALTFLVYLAVSFFIAYIASAALKPGATFGQAFQVLGSAGVLAYCFSFIPSGIWFGQSNRSLLMGMIDGVAYGLVTGAIFAAMWPKA
jgi:hypothetical protein